MTTEKSGKWKIIVALLSVYIIWGSTYLAIRIALEGFPPFMMGGVRFLTAGVLLYIFLRARGVPSPDNQQWKGAAAVGGFLLLGGNGGVVFAEQWVASGIAAMVIATTPIWMVMFSSIWGHWPSKMEWIGLLMGLLGVILLNVEGDLRAHPAGAAALLMAAMLWAFGSAWSKRLKLPSGAMAIAAEMIAGGIMLMIAGFTTGERIYEIPPIKPLSALLYLLIFGSLVGFSSYIYLLGKVRPALATSYAYVNPVIAVMLGAGFAGEQITCIGVSAMAVILAGVMLVLLGQRAK